VLRIHRLDLYGAACLLSVVIAFQMNFLFAGRGSYNRGRARLYVLSRIPRLGDFSFVLQLVLTVGFAPRPPIAASTLARGSGVI
jgi:hypothetical protein